MNEVAEGCDALVIATEWPEFKKLDLERVRQKSDAPDPVRRTKSFRCPKEMERLGFIYKSIGR